MRDVTDDLSVPVFSGAAFRSSCSSMADALIRNLAEKPGTFVRSFWKRASACDLLIESQSKTFIMKKIMARPRQPACTHVGTGIVAKRLSTAAYHSVHR